MKKSYVKPVATKVALAVNENIATSFNSGHLRYTHMANASGDTCNAYLATYGIPSKITGNANNFTELVSSLISIRESIGNEEFEKLMEDIKASDSGDVNGGFKCWAV